MRPNIQAMMLAIESDDAEHAVALEQGHSEAMEEEAQHGDEPTEEALQQGHLESLEDGIESLVHHAEESMAVNRAAALQLLPMRYASSQSGLRRQPAKSQT